MWQENPGCFVPASIQLLCLGEQLVKSLYSKEETLQLRWLGDGNKEEIWVD